MAAPETRDCGLPLLGLFADFYEEVARMKAQAAAGKLADYLAEGGSTPATPAEQARSASARLAALMLEQNRRMEQHASEAQSRMHRIAMYVMAALADEVFIFELAWDGRQEWLACLLEHRLFASRLAGRRFFELADQILASPLRDTLQRDVAACMLLAVQLGFKGMHRADRGTRHLDDLRARLWRFVNGNSPAEFDPVPFPQAYEHTVVSSRDARIAPLKPWLRAARWWACGYLAISSLLWLWFTRPLVAFPGG